MILYGNELVKKIREEFDNAKNRIWITVPFIGDWNAVKRIMGTKWITNNQLDIKIITDIRNEDFINFETIKQFLYRANVRTLAGLHAKIYIIDNSVFITSANLTATAFSKRYEICSFFTFDKTHEILNVFNKWWKISKTVDITWQPTKQENKKTEKEAGNIAGLKQIWELPKDIIEIINFKDYQDNFNLYNHFRTIYVKHGKRLLPNLTEYHELDAFLNYLFHEHKDKPSHKYLESSYRKLSDNKRISEVIKYKNEFKKWLAENQNFENYRVNNIKLIQKYLSKKKIKILSKNELEKVIDCLHTMNSHALNKFRFLNHKNNDIKAIRESFYILLHDNGTIEERMEICNSRLKFFGKSSIRELISWYYPDKYPIMNRNSNSGLKFFGYDIKTY